jgi:cell division protein FtsZ
MNPTTTVIKVLGLGGGGQNAVNRMIEFGVEGVEFIAANTDRQALANSLAPNKLLIGQTTRGLGAGGNPENGELAAEESANDIRDALRGADMVFLTAGMGGGTGTGAIPVAARIAQEMNIITVAIVSAPFQFEGPKRWRNAQSGLAKLRQHCHSLIVVPNEKLIDIAQRNVTLTDALRVADEVLRQGVQGIAELITRASTINVDFAHVCSLMQQPGGAFLAIGDGKGANKTTDAVKQMLNHRLLDSVMLTQATGVLVHFSGGNDLSLHDINQAIQLIREAISEDAEFIMGVMTDENMTGRVQITLVATGVGGIPLPEPLPRVDAVLAPASRPQAAATPAPEPALAQELFAAVKPSSEWVMQEEPQLFVGSGAKARANSDPMDLPAFLRRRNAGGK